MKITIKTKIMQLTLLEKAYGELFFMLGENMTKEDWCAKRFEKDLKFRDPNIVGVAD